jgi:O-antigen ligase
VSKNNLLNHKLLTKTNIAIFCVLGMMLGFLVSRVVLSMSMMLFGINALWNVHPKHWLKHKWWLVGVLWVAIYGISWFWSDNKDNWHERFEVKLPILLLPLAFGFLPAFSLKQLRVFTIVTSVFLLISAAYSVFFLALHPADYIYGYSISQVLPTLAKDDHIRISLCIAMFIVWCVYFWPVAGSKALKWFIDVTVVLLVFYLHVLAARTGLFALYMFVFFYAVYLALKKSKLLGLGILFSVMIFALLSVRYIPTLKNRLAYLNYTYMLYQRGEMSGMYSDMGRLISYDIALKEIAKHPLTGVGAGDMFDEVKKGYAQWYPDVTESRKLLPHNQFMLVALGCGLLTFIIFCVWVFMPFGIVQKNREGFFFLSTIIVLLVPLMVEPTLEIQFGVFVYLFFILWQRHIMLHKPVEEA